MGISIRLWLSALLLASESALAQAVIEDNRNLASDTPEAWAMRYFAGTTLLTSFGETARLAPWAWNVGFDLGSIPRLTDAQQQVGFGGFKKEDLNKSPVFGRLRLALGLPGDGVAELGYTPPLEIGGSRARNVIALAVGGRLYDSAGFTLSMRALGQLGKVQGDITCPAPVVGVGDPQENPVGCRAPSQDTFATNYYGIDATAGWDAGEWKWHLGAGIARTHLWVQVDALVLAGRDRSRLTSDGNLPWLTIGVRHDLGPRLSLAAELLYVPLNVRRPPDFSRASDPLTSVRAQLRYAVD